MTDRKFYTEKEETVVVREYDTAAIMEEVSEYLSKNEIAGIGYSVRKVEKDDHFDIFICHLERINGACIDEDFDSDPDWEDFCIGMAEDLGVRFFKVPSYYYSK